MDEREKLLEAIVRDRADWLVDAVATSMQDRRYLRGDPECDQVACESIRMNGELAIRNALRAALLPKPAPQEEMNDG